MLSAFQRERGMADGHRRLSSLLMRGGHKAADALSLGRTWGEGRKGSSMDTVSVLQDEQVLEI